MRIAALVADASRARLLAGQSGVGMFHGLLRRGGGRALELTPPGRQALADWLPG